LLAPPSTLQLALIIWLAHFATHFSTAPSSLSCRYLSFVLRIAKPFVIPFVSYVLFVDRVDIQPHTTPRLSFPFVFFVLIIICFITGILQHSTQLEGITNKRKSPLVAHSDTAVPRYDGERA
jgi:hypothetical protein